MEKIKVAVYMRVNSKEQAIDMDEQFYKLSRYADIMDFEIVNTYKDLGYSGISTDRPGLHKLKKDVQSGLIDNVLVYKLNRLTRSTEELINLMDLFDDNGVNLISANENLNTSSALGRFSIELMRSFKEALQ